ncbi:restriction endonuclease subunit S [Pseudoalteromonas sp. Angola-31]|nr:restriction endonuclease subunit S [Pseudoalteromonas sp. Angola-31]
MSNLKKHRFCDLYTMSSGISSTKDQAGHGSPFLSFSAVFNNYFVPDALPDLMDTSDKEKETYSIKAGDIFLTRTSEVVDELAMSCVAIKDYPNASYSGFLKRLRPTQTNITYSKFMAFYLRSPMFRKTMTNNAVMTLRASLNEAIFSYLDLLLPEYNEQVKAGDLLYLLNEKIELNNRINAELEAMAKTLYDYWFVQFDFPDDSPQGQGKPYKTSGGKMVYNPTLKREIPEGWEVKKLSQHLTLGSGFPFDSSTYQENGKYKVITIKNVQSEGLETDKTDFVDSVPKGMQDFCVLNIGDILMSLTGNVGRVCIVNEEDLLLNQRVGKFVCDKKWKNYFYLYFLRPESRARLEKIATGSSQKNLSPIDAVNFLHVYPSEELLNKFNEATKYFIEQIVRNSLENRKLASLRDWLLPMLMNGQVTVGEDA